MPTLNLQLNTKLVVCIEQDWNQFTKLDWYYNADGLYQHIHHETIKVPAFPEAYASFLYSSTTLSVGTIWLMERVNALIDSRMRGIFYIVMGETLKGLLSRQIIESPLDEEKRLHLTLSLDGGMDEWWVYAKAVLAMGHLHTREDILNRMWAVNPSIEGWTVVSKGDIYPQMDDDEDTRELEIVGEDDETVPGEVITMDVRRLLPEDELAIAEGNKIFDDARPTVIENGFRAFEIFIVPRLSRMKDMVSLVLIGDCGAGYKLVVWFDGRIWHTRQEYQNDTGGVHLTYTYMIPLGVAMYKACPSTDKWQMRQLTMNGLFDTIHTQDWNKADER